MTDVFRPSRVTVSCTAALWLVASAALAQTTAMVTNDTIPTPLEDLVAVCPQAVQIRGLENCLVAFDAAVATPGNDCSRFETVYKCVDDAMTACTAEVFPEGTYPQYQVPREVDAFWVHMQRVLEDNDAYKCNMKILDYVRGKAERALAHDSDDVCDTMTAWYKCADENTKTGCEYVDDFLLCGLEHQEKCATVSVPWARRFVRLSLLGLAESKQCPISRSVLEAIDQAAAWQPVDTTAPMTMGSESQPPEWSYTPASSSQAMGPVPSTTQASTQGSASSPYPASSQSTSPKDSVPTTAGGVDPVVDSSAAAPRMVRVAATLAVVTIPLAMWL